VLRFIALDGSGAVLFSVALRSDWMRPRRHVAHEPFTKDESKGRKGDRSQSKENKRIRALCHEAAQHAQPIRERTITGLNAVQSSEEWK
jgi:hypothetical protein